MNHSYALVWNDRLAAFIAAPESAQRRGKGCRVVCALVVAAAACGLAHALPSGGQVSAGEGGIAQSGGKMTIHQQSPRLAINWQAFGIGASESVTFAQPSASSIALNRVLGADPTRIRGQLLANGQVWILNPNGILFGGGAQVNVGGLVASTLGISDADFLAGRRTFSGKAGTVTNQGTLTAANGGYVAMLGGRVSNEGVIQARLGTVALGAGKQVTLNFAGDKLLNLQVDQDAVDALIRNRQLIQAEGGTVLLSAQGADALLRTVVNNTGVIEARTVESHNGTIRLLGDTLEVSGRLDASAPHGGDGGTIETSGARVGIAPSARVTTAAVQGRTGQWVIGEPDFLITRGAGHGITGDALARYLEDNNVTLRSGSGHIRINNDISWNGANSLTLSAYRDVRLVKSITSNGTGGVTVRADNAGTCVSGASDCGAIRFNPQARITVNGGPVNLYYNPPGSNLAADANGNGPTYGNPTDFRRYVHLNAGSTLNAWMLVNDVNQLQAMNTNLNGFYALGRDIDATATVGWNAGAGFVPIGSYPTPFSGSLDGLGHVIAGLTIHAVPSELPVPVGLISENDGQIQNVGLVGGSFTSTQEALGSLVGFNQGTVRDSYSTGDVSGYDFVGGLVGSNSGRVERSHSTGTVRGRSDVGGLLGASNGIVRDSHSTGAVEASYMYAGGLIGLNYLEGDVSHSYGTGSVKGFIFVGGLLGDNLGSTVSTSYSTGPVQGAFNVGGLVGQSGPARGPARITNSYSTGAVTGRHQVGGLVGMNLSGSAIQNSYSTGAVTGDLGTGGLIGVSDNGSTIQSYWNITTSGQGTSAGGTGLTDAQMKRKASFVGFDFQNVWGIDEGVSYPFLLAH